MRLSLKQTQTIVYSTLELHENIISQIYIQVNHKGLWVMESSVNTNKTVTGTDATYGIL